MEEEAHIGLKSKRHARLDGVLQIFTKTKGFDNHSQTITSIASDDDMEGNSLFIFGNQNRLRVFLLRIVKSKYFE